MKLKDRKTEEILLESSVTKLCRIQKQTIKELVELVEELRRPFMNTKHNDLYLKATEKLNQLQDQGKIE